MEVSSEVADGVAVYRVSGRIDATTCPSLDAAIKAGLGQEKPRIILDMRGVNYISSAGLRVVLAAAKASKAASGGLAIFGLQPAVQEVFTISGFTNLIPIGTDQADARAKL